MKLLCFKFHQNHTINEEFYFFEGRREGFPGGMGAPINKFLSELLLLKNDEFEFLRGERGRGGRGPCGVRGPPVINLYLIIIAYI